MMERKREYPPIGTPPKYTPVLLLPRHQWCGQDHAINCARAALRNSDASVQEVDCLLGLLSSELLTPGTNVSKQRGIAPQQDSYTNTVHIDISGY